MYDAIAGFSANALNPFMDTSYPADQVRARNSSSSSCQAAAAAAAAGMGVHDACGFCDTSPLHSKRHLLPAQLQQLVLQAPTCCLMCTCSFQSFEFRCAASCHPCRCLWTR